MHGIDIAIGVLLTIGVVLSLPIWWWLLPRPTRGHAKLREAAEEPLPPDQHPGPLDPDPPDGPAAGETRSATGLIG